MGNPEALMLRSDSAALIERAISGLPDRFRELLVLREIEGLSYREMADVMEIPIGTVMSGLSRARDALREVVNHQVNRAPEPPDDVYGLRNDSPDFVGFRERMKPFVAMT